MSDAREAIVNAAIDVLNAYGNTLTAAQKMGNLCINDTLRLMPLYCLALLKSVSCICFNTFPTIQRLEFINNDLFLSLLEA